MGVSGYQLTRGLKKKSVLTNWWKICVLLTVIVGFQQYIMTYTFINKKIVYQKQQLLLSFCSK